MSLAVVYSRASAGIDAPLVSVEVHVSNGLPSLSLVGLPETAVKESKDRVRGALINAGFEFPVKRITINLAPADLPKDGGRFDLPIALGILAASGQLDVGQLGNYEFVGELALSGELRAIKGVLPVALQTKQAGRALVLPKANAGEASFVEDLAAYPADHLLTICAHLNGRQPLAAVAKSIEPSRSAAGDFADVKGQFFAKRALEVAAAGGHSVLMYGPPGTGKTLLANSMVGILPPMSQEEALHAAAIQSVSNLGFDPNSWGQRLFRAPHHTASAVALVGGGSIPKPGEISLAHHGVLFLDELPEFDRKVLEVLRQPLESGHIQISRASSHLQFPAQFQLVAAMNPCPCGYQGDTSGRCSCTPDQVKRYRSKVSGPLLDRIDIQMEIPRVSLAALNASDDKAESSASIRVRVMGARERQLQRAGKANVALSNTEVRDYCSLGNAEKLLLEQIIEKFQLSMRVYQRVLKVARTIADLAGSETIEMPHVTEAINYRSFDRAFSRNSVLQ